MYCDNNLGYSAFLFSGDYGHDYVFGELNTEMKNYFFNIKGDSIYTIRCNRGDLALDNKNSASAGTRIQQYTVTSGRDGQRWKIRKCPTAGYEGYFSLTPMNGANLRFDNNPAGLYNPIYQQTNVVGDADKQSWQLIPTDSIYYKLACKNLGYVLDNQNKLTTYDVYQGLDEAYISTQQQWYLTLSPDTFAVPLCYDDFENDDVDKEAPGWTKSEGSAWQVKIPSFDSFKWLFGSGSGVAVAGIPAWTNYAMEGMIYTTSTSDVAIDFCGRVSADNAKYYCCELGNQKLSIWLKN